MWRSVLLLAGASSISLLDAEEQLLLEPAPGTTPLWDALLVEALFPANSDLAPLATLLGQFGANDIAIQTLDDDDWVARTQALDRPLQFGKHLWVIPGEHGTPPATADDQQRVEVNMVPGLAFGSGLHPTTALCLEWLGWSPTAASNRIGLRLWFGDIGFGGAEARCRCREYGGH